MCRLNWWPAIVLVVAQPIEFGSFAQDSESTPRKKVTLTELLQPSSVGRPSAAVQQAWETLMTATESGDPDAIRAAASTFLAIKEPKEAYQDPFGQLTLDALRQKADEEAIIAAPRDRLAKLDGLIAKADEAVQKANDEKNKPKGFFKNIGKGITGALGNAVSGKKTGSNDNASTNQPLLEVDPAIFSDLVFEDPIKVKGELEAARPEASQKLQQARAQASDSRAAFRRRTDEFLTVLEKAPYDRGVIALSRTYSKSVEDDANFLSRANEAQRRGAAAGSAKVWVLEKYQKKQLEELLTEERYLDSNKALAEIREALEVELKSPEREAAVQLLTIPEGHVRRGREEAEKNLQAIRQMMKREPTRALAMLTSYGMRYPDAPKNEIQILEQEIAVARDQFLKDRYEEQIERCTTTLRGDIEQGRECFRLLIEKTADPVEKAFLRSTVKKVIGDMAEAELSKVRDEIDQALGYLGQETTRTIKKGRWFTKEEIRTIGRENLVDARSSLVGALKRLQTLRLLVDKDPVLQAEMEGLTNKCDSAVATIDSAQQDQDKRRQMRMLLGGGATVAILAVGAMALKRKKSNTKPG
ncbi:MAG TPA: hypothetical protein PLX89_12160 [Verrucomicrobiota bacterium]|nr:hypothetical protein [Verrucomicrobiales bacterium]HRI13746.1 hypothetical protein [Verrucomicrobiota bacterium]